MEDHSTLRTKLPATSFSPVAAVDQDTEDHWLDRISAHRRQRRNRWQQLWYDSVKYPKAWAQKLWRYLTTTPGKMTSIVVLLTVAMVVTGVTMAQTAAQRRAELDTLVNNTEPVSYLAHTLYSDLSLANTLATVNFVNSAEGSESRRQQYNQALQDAAAAVASTAGGMNDSEGRPMELVGTISQKLPVYAGLVETARANARQGNPVAVAYMSEASTLMREQILPAASELYTLTGETVTQEQHHASRPLLIPLAGLGITLLGLVLAQLWLARTTRRRLNAGFLAATILLGVVTAWSAAASIVTWQAGVRGHEQAIAPMEALTDARITAQQALSSETLALVRRQSLQNSEQSFDAALKHVDSALEDFSHSPLAKDNEGLIDTAHDAAEQWSRVHTRIAEAISTGDFDSAWSATTDRDQSFEQLDQALASIISDTRSATRSFIERGIVASSLLSLGVLIMTGLAIIAVWVGIRPRLQEYL